MAGVLAAVLQTLVAMSRLRAKGRRVDVRVEANCRSLFSLLIARQATTGRTSATCVRGCEHADPDQALDGTDPDRTTQIPTRRL